MLIYYMQCFATTLRRLDSSGFTTGKVVQVKKRSDSANKMLSPTHPSVRGQNSGTPGSSHQLQSLTVVLLTLLLVLMKRVPVSLCQPGSQPLAVGCVQTSSESTLSEP